MDRGCFTQGMSHEQAVNSGFMLNRSQGAISFDMYQSVYYHMESLKSRPDYDGFITKDEADAWWLSKSGEPLFVDQSKIELPGISTKTFGNKAGNSTYQNFIWGLSNTGKVYGTLKMTLKSPTTGTVHIGGQKYIDKYDFDMDNRPLRNFATWWGRPGGATAGKDYYIYGYGNARVPVVK